MENASYVINNNGLSRLGKDRERNANLQALENSGRSYSVGVKWLT